MTAALAALQLPTELVSEGARIGQFVFVVDDSGSMRDTDPERLALFAVRSIVSMLDDRDEATIVGLNQPSAPPLRPLQQNRQELLGLADVAQAGGLATYRGGATPCRTALARVQALLAQAWRPNAAQVVMMLSDGDCTEAPLPAAFLQGLPSHAAGLLRFYLIRFGARLAQAQSIRAEELRQIVARTRGTDVAVGADDPGALLHAFADALVHSQGFEAQLVDPSHPVISANRGAKRVRLLAIARDAGANLAFSLSDEHGQTVAVGPTHAGQHQYGPSARVFRFASADYRPTLAPVTVQVSGAGSAWKVVAAPEYRLYARLALRQGDCRAEGAIATGSAPAGAGLAVWATLEDERGQVVSRGITGGEMSVRVLFGRTGQAPEEKGANPVDSQARFCWESGPLETGDWTAEAVLRMGQGRELRSASRSMSVTSLDFRATPAALDFGEVVPGADSPPQAVVFEGNFSDGPGRLTVDHTGLEPCLSFSWNGTPEGESEAITHAPQTYLLSVRVAPYCAPRSFEKAYDVPLRVQLEGVQGLAGAALRARFKLRHEFEWRVPDDVHLRAGEQADVTVEVRSNARRPFAFQVGPEPGQGAAAWPEDDLDLAPVEDPETDVGAAGGIREHAVRFDLGAVSGPRWRLRSQVCCRPGTYTVRLKLTPAEGGASADPWVVPLRVVVAPAGFLACYGRRLLALLGLLLLAAAVAYIVMMFRHSSFLSAEWLADHCVPLRWDAFGDPRPHPARQAVRDMMGDSLQLPQRIGAWVRANPLKFGLPGHSYTEALQLVLVPHNDVLRSQALLLHEADLLKTIEASLPEWDGQLLAVAEAGGAAFWAVPTRNARVGPLLLERLADGGTGAPWTHRLVRLRRHEQLIRDVEPSSRAAGEAAGWQVN